jgi:hypothetical protein
MATIHLSLHPKRETMPARALDPGARSINEQSGRATPVQRGGPKVMEASGAPNVAKGISCCLGEGRHVGSTKMCDYSLHAVKTRLANVNDKLTICMFGVCEVSPHLKTETWQFAYRRGLNCPLRKRSGKYILGHCPHLPSATRRRSSVRSINTIGRLITTR